MAACGKLGPQGKCPLQRLSEALTQSCLSAYFLLLCVMADLGCQLDHSWNQLKPKQLGMPVRAFLD